MKNPQIHTASINILKGLNLNVFTLICKPGGNSTHIPRYNPIQSNTIQYNCSCKLYLNLGFCSTIPTLRISKRPRGTNRNASQRNGKLRSATAAEKAKKIESAVIPMSTQTIQTWGLPTHTGCVYYGVYTQTRRMYIIYHIFTYMNGLNWW